MNQPWGSSDCDSSWPRAESFPTLVSGAVHVWSLSLQGRPEQIDAGLELLTEDERAQARRFVRPELTRRFVRRRASLRGLLARYTSVRAEELVFRQNAFGKPSVAAPLLACGVRFNLSHSQDLALVAVSNEDDLGVDIERVRPLADQESLSRRYFAPLEQEAISRQVASERVLAFFRIWTGKEAILKAFGVGLAGGLERAVIALSETPAEDPQLAAIDPEFGLPQSWQLRALHPAAGYMATLAVRATTGKVHCWHWGD